MPVAFPLHKTFVVAVMLTASNDGLITVFKSVVVHPLAEVTVTV